MDAKTINILLGKLCSKFALSQDLEKGGEFKCTSNVIRVATKMNTYLQDISVFSKDSVGIFIPEGCIEYFTVNEGDIIKVIEGNCNICSAN